MLESCPNAIACGRCRPSCASFASSQDPAPVYQKPEPFRFTIELVARQEWTNDIFVSPTETRSEDRFVGWALPGVEVNAGKFLIIDIESGDYELDDDDMAATRRAHARHPDGAFYGMRVGYRAAEVLGGSWDLAAEP